MLVLSYFSCDFIRIFYQFIIALITVVSCREAYKSHARNVQTSAVIGHAS